MANPLRTVALSLVLAGDRLPVPADLTPQFFPGVDRDQFHIEVDLPPGTGIAETLRVVREIDASWRPRRMSLTWPGWWAGRPPPSTTTWSATAIRPRPSRRR
jgi:multidrug efflux pump subunit AcrB